MLNKTEEKYLEMIESKFGKDKALEYRKVLEAKKLAVTKPEPEKEIEPEESEPLEEDRNEINELIQEKKLKILDRIEKQLDKNEEEDGISKLFLFIEKSPRIRQEIMNFFWCIQCYAKYPTVRRFIYEMVKDKNDNEHGNRTFHLFDENDNYLDIDGLTMQIFKSNEKAKK